MKRLLTALYLATLVFDTSLAEGNRNPTDRGDAWTTQRFEREFCGDDPWEPFNRAMFGVFDFCMTYAVDPFCRVYSSIIPKPLIEGIDNFCENLESPRFVCANLLMGEWRPAWEDAARFAVNSTVGVGGLFDPADGWLDLPGSNASLSDTFVRWGIPAGPRLALPFMPRATVRGHVGYVCDYAFDLKTWFDFLVPSGIFLGWSWCLTPNKAPVWRGGWEYLFAHAADGYSVYMPLVTALNDFNLRQYAWHGQDEAESSGVEDVRPPVHASAVRPASLAGEWRDIPGFSPRAPSLDSLRALCFAPLGNDSFWWERRSIFNRDFSKKIEERSIVIAQGAPEATYSYVGAREDGTSERLVFILPGIGSGRTATEAVAMAECLHEHGYGAVICDSVFHWEHMRSVNRGMLPGNLVEDAKRFGYYLGLILSDLRRAERIEKPEVNVIGWSMGGLTVAHLAVLDRKHGLPFSADRFVAINPPVSIDHALEPFETVMAATRSWTREEAYEMFAKVAPSLYAWAAQDHPRFDPACPPKDENGADWDYAPNLTEAQAGYLLGETMHVMLPTLIAERHRNIPFPWLVSEVTACHRRAFYAELGDVSMREYIARYVPACYEGVTGRDILATAEFKPIESVLVQQKKFVILHTWNDPLETDDDRLHIDELFGKRITWFADGSHCGMFYTKPFQDELLRRLGE